MFRSALEPDIFDDADEGEEVEFVEYICPKETFASIGLPLATIIDNSAIAASIAQDAESPIEVLFGAEHSSFFVIDTKSTRP